MIFLDQPSGWYTFKSITIGDHNHLKDCTIIDLSLNPHPDIIKEGINVPLVLVTRNGTFEMDVTNTWKNRSNGLIDTSSEAQLQSMDLKQTCYDLISRVHELERM